MFPSFFYSEEARMTELNTTTLPSPRLTTQFRISSLLWLMVTSGAALGYLRLFELETFLGALCVVIGGILVGVTVGTATENPRDSLYWAVYGALFAFLFAINTALPHWTYPYAWAGVGAVAGAHGGAVKRSNLWRALARGLGAATFLMLVYTLVIAQYGGDFLFFDILCAAISGALLIAIAQAADWFQRRKLLSRDSVAAGLMLSVILINFVARTL